MWSYKYFNYILLVSDDWVSAYRHIVVESVKGRCHCRPRKTWRECVEDMSKLKLSVKDTQDRAVWRKVILLSGLTRAVARKNYIKRWWWWSWKPQNLICLAMSARLGNIRTLACIKPKLLIYWTWWIQMQIVASSIIHEEICSCSCQISMRCDCDNQLMIEPRLLRNSWQVLFLHVS